MSLTKKYYTSVICILSVLIGIGISLSGFAAGEQKVTNSFGTQACALKVITQSTDTTINNNVKRKLVDIGVAFSQRLEVSANSNIGLNEYVGYMELGASRLNNLENQIRLSQVQKSMVHVISSFLSCQGETAQGNNFNFVEIVQSSGSSSSSSSSGGSTNSSSSSSSGGGITVDQNQCKIVFDNNQQSALQRSLNGQDVTMNRNLCTELCDGFGKEFGPEIGSNCYLGQTVIKRYGSEIGSSNSSSSSGNSTSRGATGGVILIPEGETFRQEKFGFENKCFIGYLGKYGEEKMLELSKTHIPNRDGSTEYNKNICLQVCDSREALSGVNAQSCYFNQTKLKVFGECKMSYALSSTSREGIENANDCKKICATIAKSVNEPKKVGYCEFEGDIIQNYPIITLPNNTIATPPATPALPLTVPTKVTMNCGIARDAVSNWYYTKGRCPAQAGYDNWMGQVSQRMKNGMKGVDAVNEVFPLFASAYNQSCSAYGNLSACHDAQLCPAGYTYVRNSTNCNKK